MGKKISLLLGLFLILNTACSKKESPKPESAPTSASTPAEVSQASANKPGTPIKLKIPLGLLDDLNIPMDNPLTQEKIDLGKLLYFDGRLSVDGTISCATCHDPKKGWTDNLPVSMGVKSASGARNAPTIINSTYMLLQFWDGRAKNLEEQSLMPVTNPVEMACDDHDVMVNNLKKVPGYRPLFQKAFGDEAINKDRVAQAIASFERTVLSGNSRFDRWDAGDKSAMNEAEIRGRDLFFGKANCTRCHAGSTFSDSDFHNLGVGMNKPKPDLGRFDQTKDEKDKGAFKTPTVRDISKTFPYMHDGSQKTLEEVVEFYDKGGEANPHLDTRVVKLNLTAQEKSDLVAFMKALDGDPYPMVEKPILPE